MSWSLRRERERVVGDLQGEVLGHLELVDHLAHPQRDLVPPAQRPAVAAGGRGDLVQLVFGGGQQLVAFAGPLGGQRRVVAAHQPLAGIVRGADLDEVLLVEQRQLQRVGLDEGLDLRGAQRADPIQPARAQLVADARGR